jgi:hypothetical protein
MLIFSFSFDYKKQCCHIYEMTIRQYSHHTYQDVDMPNKVVVMMIRTKEVMDTTKLYSQTRSTKQYLILQSFYTVMTMSSGKQIQISQGKLTRQILNVILTTKGCWYLSITAKHVLSQGLFQFKISSLVYDRQLKVCTYCTKWETNRPIVGS